jgi:hypothetical protein
MYQFSWQRMMVFVALCTIGLGMIRFLSLIAYVNSAQTVLGSWAGVASEVAFCLWVASALLIGAGFGCLLKNSKIGAAVGILIFVAIAIWFQSPIER